LSITNTGIDAKMVEGRRREANPLRRKLALSPTFFLTSVLIVAIIVLNQSGDSNVRIQFE
tara:strand:+ start:131 stop:310 length:180 start_codon:yes stop_codon:yes gene_type:complete